jgi:hypothetical protein
MKEYFLGGKFQLDKFLLKLLEAVEATVMSIFAEKLEPPQLEIVTSNEQFAGSGKHIICKFQVGIQAPTEHNRARGFCRFVRLQSTHFRH